MASHIKCVVPGCTTVEKRRFFRFPNPKLHVDRYFDWIRVIGNPKLKHESVNFVYDKLRVCERHFKADDYLGRSLKTEALPTLNLAETLKLDVNIDLPNEADKIQINVTPPSPLSRTPETLQKQLNISPLRKYVEKQINVDDAMAIDDQEPQPGTSTDFQPKSVSAKSLLEEDKRVVTKKIKQKRSYLSVFGITSIKNLQEKEQILYTELRKIARKARRLEIKNASYRKRLYTVKQLIQTTAFERLTMNFTSFQLRFFESQIRNSSRKKQGRMYTFQDKADAVALWKYSPKMYKILSNLFSLPSVSTLRKVLNHIILEPGISDSIFQLLKNKFSKCSIQDRICTLIFDEMQLAPHLDYLEHKDKVIGFKDNGWNTTNEIANHVIVFMLRGIHKNWKQPVAYGFSKGAMAAAEIVHFYKEIVKKAKYAGLKIISSVCDQGTTNTKAIDMLLEATTRAAIINNQQVENGIIRIDNEEIVPLFDVPHLMKSMRNNLLIKNLSFVKDGVQFIAKWEHILNTYLIDKEYNIRVMRKLTDSHILPEKIKKMKVSICTQVFSESAAAALKYCATFNAKSKDATISVPSEGLETAELFIFLDKVFDSLNCSKSSSTPGKPLKEPVSAKSLHEKFWISALKIFESMKFICAKPQDRSKPPVLHGWVRTLKGFLMIKHKLLKLGFKTFTCRYFNQDPIENFFCLVRQYGVRNTNPSCYQFQNYYKSLLIQNFANTQSRFSNCEKDYGLLAVDLKQLMQTHTKTDIPGTWHPPETTMEQSSLTEDAAVAYISGYLAKNILPIIKDCDTCKHNLLLLDPPEPYHKFIEVKEREGCNLQYVNDTVFTSMKQLYFILYSSIPTVLHVNCILKRMQSYVNSQINFNFTGCQHTENIRDILVKKFILLYLYSYLKKLNNISLGKMYVKNPDVFEHEMMKYYKFYKNK